MSKSPATAYSLSLPERSGTAFRAAGNGAVCDTRTPEWSAAGAAAGVVPGRYRVELYTTQAGADSARIHAADAWTLAAATARKLERAAVAARKDADAASAALAAIPVPALANTPTPPRPAALATPEPTPVPDAAAILAALPADALAALMAQLTGK